ncbi:hypothetical protein ACE38V_14800 [Cytobacillus sp. Hz8]
MTKKKKPLFSEKSLNEIANEISFEFGKKETDTDDKKSSKKNKWDKPTN